MHIRCLVSVLALAAILPFAPVRADENTYTQSISVGGYAAELTLRFENVVGLNLSNLGISTEIIDPLDPSLQARLSSGANPLGAFPLLVRIQPPITGGLSFSGIVTVEIYTHDLTYVAGNPFRFYSAPDGGTFIDITSYNSSGSYRTGGGKGTFSEFLIVADLRSHAQAISAKFARLDALLAHHAGSMPGAVYNEIQSLSDSAQAAYAAEDLVTAIGDIEDFDAAVRAHSGNGIPDVWRSARDLTNVAGELRAAAATLRFSLTQAANAS